MKVLAKRCDQLHIFFAVQTIVNFWWDLDSFDKKVWPVTRFSLWRLSLVFDGTLKVSAKRCDQLHVFSLWRLTWVFEGTWKDLPSYTFFSLWRLTWVFEGTWKNFHKKVCPVICFFAVGTILSFWWGLEKFPQKFVPSYTFFFAVETNLSFWWDLEKFSQKSVPSHTFLRCGDYLKVLMGLRKISTKIWAQLHVFFDVETNLSFWWDLEKFSQKSLPSHTFLRCGDYLKFLMGLEKFRQKDVTSYTFFSQCRLP